MRLDLGPESSGSIFIEELMGLATWIIIGAIIAALCIVFIVFVWKYSKVSEELDGVETKRQTSLDHA